MDIVEPSSSVLQSDVDASRQTIGNPSAALVATVLRHIAPGSTGVVDRLPGRALHRKFGKRPQRAHPAIRLRSQATRLNGGGSALHLRFEVPVHRSCRSNDRRLATRTFPRSAFAGCSNSRDFPRFSHTTDRQRLFGTVGLLRSSARNAPDRLRPPTCPLRRNLRATERRRRVDVRELAWTPCRLWQHWRTLRGGATRRGILRPIRARFR